MLGIFINAGAAALLIWAFVYVALRMYRSSRGKCGSCPDCGGCSGNCASCGLGDCGKRK